MLTAAVRDLHRLHPGKFLTDVCTSCPSLWLGNPYITPLPEGAPEVRSLECHYPLIQRANQEPWHFLHGYAQFLSGQLGVGVYPTSFRGDIHITDAEKVMPSPVEVLHGFRGDYWIIAAGGKYDYTIKWWHRRRWQAVVDALKGVVRFVQVGESGHYHPPLSGVIDLRGRTTLRDLVRLVYWSRGVVCPVTALMHLAAAVPLPCGRTGERACVVVAGGREPPHWEAYPWHRFLHTVGALPCCMSGGCWKARTVPLGDGDPKDQAGSLCTTVNANEGLPECMAMISPSDVVRAVLLYLNQN